MHTGGETSAHQTVANPVPRTELPARSPRGARSQRDIRDASLYQQYMLPKLFIKIQSAVDIDF